MPQVKQVKVFQFDELDENAKEKAREWFRDGAFDYEWYDSVYYDAKEIGKILGITIDKIYFSGFWSQGDGACFVVNYEYAKQAVKGIKEYAPLDTELHRIAQKLQAIQKPSFYKLTANIKHSGHYYHKYCTNIEVCKEYDSVDNDELVEVLRDFMDWLYKQLEKEYDYLNSDESVDETIKINEYEFTENGKRYCYS